MPANNDAVSMPAASQTRSRKFSVSDSMALIGGVALFLAYDRRAATALLDQLFMLVKNMAAYSGIISAPYPPQFVAKYMQSHWETVLWYGLQVSEQSV